MELYDAQRTIGRRECVSYESLEDYANDAEKSDVLNRIERLISLDIMSGDESIKRIGCISTFTPNRIAKRV